MAGLLRASQVAAAFIVLIFVLFGASGPASAASYPDRAIRLIVPSAPGGGVDVIARFIAPGLTQYLGQQIVVDARPGAGGIVGAMAVLRTPADGYTLMVGGSSFTIIPSLSKTVPYDFVQDFAPISVIGSMPNVLVSNPSLPAASLKQLIALAKARPEQLQFASAGVGTNPHLAMELFVSMAGVKMIHVPYKGVGPGLIDVMGGQVPLMAPNILSALPLVRNGKLRGYGVTGLRRSEAIPDIPTMAEAGVPGYEAVQWYGLFAPAATPPAVNSKLYAALASALQESAIRARFVLDGTEPGPSKSPQEFASFTCSEVSKWAKVIKQAGIQPE